MLSDQDKAAVLKNAYIPEHSFDLICAISGGEPFLEEDCLFYWKKGELILNGYPLNRTFDINKFEEMIHRLKRRFRPSRISYIAPQHPASLAAADRESVSDEYYTLDLSNVPMPAPVKRNIRNASRQLTIEQSSRMDRSHQLLIDEFVDRANPGGRVERLLEKLPDYVHSRSGGVVLNARDGRSRLNAFYIVDLAPNDFSTYIIGCYTRHHYITGASDLLMDTLVSLSRQAGKHTVHLGLGINEGLRRFKRKWGGRPERAYRMGSVDLKLPAILTAIRDFLKRP